MLPVRSVNEEFFFRLERLDAAITEKVLAARCRHCQGPLHRGNYHRKPRGGAMAGAGEAFTLRHSLCCGRRGCRKRSMPPSLRFLGRRVYLEVVVVLATVLAQITAQFRQAVSTSGVPGRTLRRWGSWWRDRFPRLPAWAELRARFIPPPPDETQFPLSLYDRIAADLQRPHGAGAEPDFGEVMLLLARCLAPTTTGSVADGSRFVNAIFTPTATG